ncbi:hypothetical protein GO755_33335 [Spirosoma sp. HMF4905]|uniref:Uncharacterized protein n=1 Tax=Spirosoma arboris TaxID=2682092 RepID=A0A7K1SMD0_9BACT|nr:hypothetical protein [Spirosoma arboris]MVM34959.1 hypothetical protein [Spirosoma arboris]
MTTLCAYPCRADTMPNQFRILVVDDDPDLVEILRLAAPSSFLEASFTLFTRADLVP